MLGFALVSESHAILWIGAEFTHWPAPALQNHYQSIAGFHAGFLANDVRHCYHGLHREYGPLVAALSQALKNRDEQSAEFLLHCALAEGAFLLAWAEEALLGKIPLQC
jgi:hypothetical protein